jgi:hypothetical protein
MTQSMTTMLASFTPSKKVITASLRLGAITLTAAAKMIVKKMRGRSSRFAAAWIGFRGMMFRRVSMTRGASSASCIRLTASPSKRADRASRVESSIREPGFTTLDTRSPMVTATAVVHR